MLRGSLIVLGALILAFGALIVALENPSTKGPVRCWLQETLYTQEWQQAPAGTPVIEAVRTTEPVRDMCDAADDPAIWQAGETFFVLGTNKQRSLNVYDAAGKLVSRADDLGAPNNVDMREWEGRVLAFASDKDDAQIEGFVFDPSAGALDPIAGAPFAAVAEDEVYGLCLYKSAAALYVFTTDKSGMIVQYRLEPAGADGPMAAREVRRLRVATQPEACAVDDAASALYVGEEDIGVWRFDAREEGGDSGELIAKTGDEGPLTADVEGLAIYAGEGPDQGYLIASSQGDNTFAVFDRAAPHRFRGRFQVAHQGTLIGDTDGIAVQSGDLGGQFESGLMVIQDGFIRTGGREGAQAQTGERRQQRFAYVAWADIAAVLDLERLPLPAR